MYKHKHKYKHTCIFGYLYIFGGRHTSERNKKREGRKKNHAVIIKNVEKRIQHNKVLSLSFFLLLKKTLRVIHTIR